MELGTLDGADEGSGLGTELGKAATTLGDKVGTMMDGWHDQQFVSWYIHQLPPVREYIQYVNDTFSGQCCYH